MILPWVKDALYYFNLGLSSSKEGNHEKAIESYIKAIEINPNYPQIYYNLANIYNETNQFDKAIENYKKAIELDSKFFAAYNNLGITYAKKEEYKLAVENHKKAVEIEPNFLSAYISLGITYYKQRKYLLSLDILNKALEISPNNAGVYKNLGVSYIQTDIFKAIECLKKSILLNPNDKETYNSLAIAYYQTRELDLSIDNYNKTLQLDPNYADGKSNLSAVHLIKGDFEKGWELYENRFFKDSSLKVKIPQFSKPRWQGESLKDKVIYVYKEQGFGDTIMFSRYILLLREIAKKVIFRPQPQLKNLFLSSDFDVEIIDNSISDENIVFDRHIPLLSLPLIFKTNLNNIPYTEKYLKADFQKEKFYKENYFNNNKFKVGIFWYGDHRYVPQKSTDLSYFYPLAQCSNIQLYSLQKGYGYDQLENKPKNIDIMDLGKTFNDYSDTAAAIANIDLLITIDTSVAHLAGAMNKLAWVLLYKESEWRWMMDIDYSPWYKSLKIFRQKEKNNWETVFQDILQELSRK